MKRRVVLAGLVALVAAVLGVSTLVAAPAQFPTCAWYPTHGFGQLWFTGYRIAWWVGCPTTGEYGTQVTEQRFQYGQAIWFADTHTVFVLTNTGVVIPYSGYSSIGHMYAWHPWVRGRLGWPLEAERSATASWQDFERGVMYWTHRMGRLVIVNGRFERY